jgi:hypothetical protein
MKLDIPLPRNQKDHFGLNLSLGACAICLSCIYVALKFGGAF